MHRMLDSSNCHAGGVQSTHADRAGHERKLAIVGGFGGTHIGGSLARAAAELGLNAITFDIADARRGPRLLRALVWRASHRPLYLAQFSAGVVQGCSRDRPDLLVSTGAAALTERSIRALRVMGIFCMNYSTDDPWNPNQRSRWHLRALPAYDTVFTPRRANIEDFRNLGCQDVRYLPFGYDDAIFGDRASGADVRSHDVLFVGGADRDRVAFISGFMEQGPPVTVVGAYWERTPALRPYALGHRSPEELRALTAAAKVNLCLVRRANRDDHVMRSFEIGAIGGCTIAEDTPGHRAIFGADGEAVRYFRTPAEAAALATALVPDAAERARLAAAIRARVTRGSHTYRDRLATMLSAATQERQAES
jgi:hypothetical protein